MKNNVKKLKTKAENLWKKICLKKYGKYCHVKRYYPHINIRHTGVIQVDHCISRTNKYYFLDIRNGLPVCSGCNCAKSFHNKSVSRAIDGMVKKRNPEWFDNAVWLDQTKEPNTNFSRVWWLEEQVQDLQREWGAL